MTARDKPHTATLPAPIRALNVGQRLAERVGLNPISLRKHDLMEKASRKAGGLTDFGDSRFEVGLDRLLDSLENGNKLSGFGRLVAKGQITNLLHQRLLMTEHVAAHPEIRDEPIGRPIFIIGAARTGTTITHHLLAQDDRFRFPYTWECNDLYPPLDPATMHSDPRIDRSQKGLDQMLRLMPEMDAAHPVGALEAQECMFLHAYDFHSLTFLTTLNCQSYDRWLTDQDLTWVYERERLFLQYLQSGGLRPAEGWLLKSPSHLENIDCILEAFPDARFVTTFREPAEVIASSCSLVSHVTSLTERDHDRHDLGRFLQERIWRMLERNVELRERFVDQSDRFIDFPMQRMVKDPVTCVSEIYDHFGIDLPPARRQKMEAFMERRNLTGRKPHLYDPKDWGLDLRAIWPRYERYREFYGIEGTPP